MRMLVAVDGSPSSLQARDLVARLPLPPASKIWLMSAYQVPIDWVPPAQAMPWVGETEDAIRDELVAELELLAGPLQHAGREVETVLVRGRPATEIIAQARSLDVDVIVVGSRGRGPLVSMLLGSVSAEVVDHAPCPVLVTRSDHVSHLLVATDGSDLARRIPDVLGRWGLFRDTKADVVSVALPPERMFDVLAEVYTLGSHPAEDRQDVLDRHRRFAEETAERLIGAGIPATSAVLVGDAAHEIISAAQRSGADLIITGSRGLRGLDRLFLGSVARGRRPGRVSLDGAVGRRHHRLEADQRWRADSRADRQQGAGRGTGRLDRADAPRGLRDPGCPARHRRRTPRAGLLPCHA